MHHKDPAEEASLLKGKNRKKDSVANNIKKFLFGSGVANAAAKKEEALKSSDQRASDNNNGATEGFKPTCPKSESPRALRPK